MPAGGIGYADETVIDRDTHGVLWPRTPLRHGVVSDVSYPQDRYDAFVFRMKLTPES